MRRIERYPNFLLWGFSLVNHALVSLVKITKMYTKTKGVQNIDLNTFPGEIHGLIGMNGAGKTTILKVILGLLYLDSGNLLWNDKIVTHGDLSYKRQLSYVPDDEALLEHLTPWEIVRFVGQAYGISSATIEGKARRLFELLGLGEIHDSVDGFSRGMRKKVQLASALLPNSRLLVLDEPIAGFDPNTIYLMKKLLIELKKKGTSILVSSHDLNFAEELCDRVTFVHQGQVLLSGHIAQLLDQHKCKSLEELFVSKTLNPGMRIAFDDVVAHL